MKKIFLIFVPIFLFTHAYCQLNLFGVDLSKHLSYDDNVTYKKVHLIMGNPYFTNAEYKIGNFDFERGFILYDNLSAKVRTPQMKHPNRYMSDLKKNISSSFGKEIKLFFTDSLSNPVDFSFLWVKKYKDKYLVAELEFAGNYDCDNCDQNRCPLTVCIYDNKEILFKGLKHKYLAVDNWNRKPMYFDEKLISNLN